MAALSPFRYAQLCRYIIQQFLSRPPPVWKGKGKEGGERVLKPGRGALTFATAAMEHGHERGGEDYGPVAGPSRIPLPPNPRSTRQPLRSDPDLPPEPSEIYRLMNDERLLVQGGAEPPREVIVLCHGRS